MKETGRDHTNVIYRWGYLCYMVFIDDFQMVYSLYAI